MSISEYTPSFRGVLAGPFHAPTCGRAAIRAEQRESLTYRVGRRGLGGTTPAFRFFEARGRFFKDDGKEETND